MKKKRKRPCRTICGSNGKLYGMLSASGSRQGEGCLENDKGSAGLLYGANREEKSKGRADGGKASDHSGGITGCSRHPTAM